ncbi:helix-turn-helix domain-containing protein [Streptomyces sp. NPDC093097]|uniref:helix-turn-helix domain-containing protein n=1 Tax=Streptomyces sp. NPDC093097 TaxID=3366027 RepID=UPI00382E5D2E
MSTDFQTARVSLGARLRELRTEAGLNGKEMAGRLRWQPSKISRLENGKQTPSRTDLEAWAAAAGQPEATAELQGRLQGLETQYRTWRRQLANGHRSRQELAVAETARTQMIRGVEVARIPGLFQTADYARHLFTANAVFRNTPRDTESAVRARMQRQGALYEAGRSFRFVVWEAALYAQVCPPEVMAAQLDRLCGLIGMDTVELGIVPFTAPLQRTPAHGFWIYDERLVTVETINAELWLDDADSISLYTRAWTWLHESAVHGHPAQRLIARARAHLTLP